MSKFTKRSAAVLLALVLILGLVLAVSAEEDAPARALGKRQTEHTGSTAVTDAWLAGKAAGTQDNDTLPSSYDSRNYGYITPVRNQNPYGTCWAHGALGSAEAYMVKHGVIDAVTGAPATTSINLSEYHLAWFSYTNAYDKLGMLVGDKSSPNYYGYSYLDLGGNGEIATYTLMRWEGTASETVSALKYSNASTSGLSSTYAYQYDNAHVQGVDWIPTVNMDAVKRAIMYYGAGTFGYCHEDAYANDSTGAYCYIQNAEPGDYNYDYSNHDVTVVGWDDNYPRTNFNAISRPQHNGAWIIKNSWGTSYGDSGYIYISYEDTASLNDYCYFYEVEPLDNYDNIYQYDGTTNFSNYNEMASGSSIANAFTANGSELLEAASICTWDEGVSYTLRIYTDFTGSNPTNGTLAAEKSGFITYMGYHTIKLDTPVLLSQGQRYAVVFTLNASELNVPYDVTATGSWIKWVHASHANCSFYRNANGSWNAAPAAQSYRIKAYTSEIPTPIYNIQAVSNDESMGTVTVVGSQILAQPADGCYVQDAQVLEGEAELSINGNTITVNAQSDCTVKVIFAQKRAITVTFSAAGTLYSSDTVWAGDAMTLPAVPPTSNYTAVGWCLAPVQTDTPTVPTFYKAGASYTPTDDVTLYALYSHLSGVVGAGGDYLAVNDGSELTDGTYLIVYEAGSLIFDGSLSTLDQGHNHYSVTINDGRIARSDRIDAAAFTVSPDSGAVKSASGWYIGRNSSTRNGLDTSSAPLENTISIQNGNAVIVGKGGLCLRYNDNAGTTGERFRYYSSTSQKPIRLYRKDGTTGDPLYTTMPEPHVHTPEFHEQINPTCLNTGEAAYWCCTDPNCLFYGKRFVDQALTEELTNPILPALGHDYAAEVTEPTCTDGGWTVFTCTRCGDSYTGSETAALGHDWDEGSVIDEPTCTAAGKTLYTCKRCKKQNTETVDALGHDFVVTVYEPTCTDGGYTSHACTRCRYGYSDNEVAALGHDYNAVTVEPTCTDGGFTTHTCSRCADAYVDGETEALGHDWDNGKVLVKPLCEVEGQTVYTCARCKTTRTETVAALGHDLLDVVYEPTCTEGGWTFHHCTRCKYGFNDSETEALGHAFSEWKQTKAPTCLGTGSERRSCERCTVVENREVAALGHDYKTVTVEPTCTERGYTTYTCSRCASSYTANMTAALGHSFTAWTQTKAPTCLAAGSERRSCERCNTVENRELDALGHDYTAVISAPTCTQKGVATYTCVRCADRYVVDESDALGHAFGAWAEFKAPGCLTRGEERRTCTRCGEYESRELAALGHSYVTEVIVPTCTGEGRTARTCTRCGDYYADNLVPPTGHDYEDIVVAPSCFDQGYTTHICRVCGERYMSDVTEKLPHDFKDGVCTVCGAKDPDYVPPFRFDDVRDPEAFYFDAVYWAYFHEPQITTGTSETAFSPDRPVTRGQAMTFLWRSAGEPRATGSNNPFTDVRESSFYYDAVLWAVEQGITTGTSADKFTPNGTCTKGHIITFIYRWMGEPETTAENPFTDVSEKNFYYKAALWATENGLVDEATGVTADKFNPRETCTRGQTVTFLHRAEGTGIRNYRP